MKAFVLYAFVLLLCAIVSNVFSAIEVSNRVEELKFWNDPRIKSRKPTEHNRRSKDGYTKQRRPVRHNHEEIKRKLTAKNSSLIPAAVFKARSGSADLNVSWPKVAPRFRAKKSSARMTQMMLQEAEETSPRYVPLNEDDLTEELSPYAIKEQLTRISSKFPNTNISVEVIGRTVEYNDIVMLRISELSDLQRHFRAEDDKYADEWPQKKIVLIVHGLSVMGLSSLQCLSAEKDFAKLLSFYLAHLDNFDIFLIPLANPDGFGRSQYDRFWNKNMSPQNACPGVNVDRNFDVAWNGLHVISSCSQQYPGTTPFSETESRAIRDVFHKYSHKIVAYFHVHAGSYDDSVYKGEAVLYPKGFSEVQSDDDKYIDLRGEIDEAMRNASFQTISVAVVSLYNWYGKVFGTSVDYAATIYGIPYSMELVMQLYEDYYFDTDEKFSEAALDEIWSRVIDVIFKNIWKNTQSTDP